MLPPTEIKKLAPSMSSEIVKNRLRRNIDQANQHMDDATDGIEADLESRISSIMHNPGLKSMGPDVFAQSMDDSLNRRNPGLKSAGFWLTSLAGQSTGSVQKPSHSQLKEDFIQEMRVCSSQNVIVKCS